MAPAACAEGLFNSEAWSNLLDKDIEKLEHVDMAAIRAVVDGGHSKCPKAFYFLETFSDDKKIYVPSPYPYPR